MKDVSGAETERSGPKLGWNRVERERGAADGNGAVSGGQKNLV